MRSGLFRRDKEYKSPKVVDGNTRRSPKKQRLCLAVVSGVTARKHKNLGRVAKISAFAMPTDF